MFKFSTPLCPECGGKPGAILETLEAWAFLDGNGEYVGESDVLWDTQIVDDDDVTGECTVICCECKEMWNTKYTDDDSGT